MLVPFGKALVSADFLRAGACAAILLAAACSGPGQQQSMQPAQPDAKEPPQAGARTQGNGAQSEPVSDTALPPNNLAGAYLVRPEANSCFWEEKSENKAIVALCGVSFVAEPQTDPSKRKSEEKLQLKAENANKDLVSPIGTKDQLAGLSVVAKDATQAIERAQDFLNPSSVILNTDSDALESQNHRYFRYKPGKFIVYGRMDRPEDAFTAKSIAFGLEFRKVSPSSFGSLPSSLEPGALLDAVIGRLLTEAGLQFMDVSTPLIKQSPQDGPRRSPQVLSTTSLKAADVEAILRMGSEALDELFK